MDVSLPNFLLVGAPKCGTTAIASHMALHPDIYMSAIKEPKYFTAQFISFPLRGPGDEFVENFTVKTLEIYKKLFQRVNGEKAVGEASVDNLYFPEQVIPLIKTLLGDVKIIIVLRNPVDRAFSAYKNLLRDGRETLTFEEGLRMEQQRRLKGYEYLWRYRGLGFYYEPVKAYMANFTHVKVFILEHFEKGSFELLEQIFRFLNVNVSFKPKRRTTINASGEPILKWLQRLFNPTGFKGSAYKFLALEGFDVDRLMRWVEPFRDRNIRPIHMNPETRMRLQKMYVSDMKKLEQLLKTDLSAWLDSKDDSIFQGA